MTGQGETLRQKASWLMNDYEALGPRPGGESAYAETMMAYQQHAQCPPASPAAGDFICPTVR